MSVDTKRTIRNAVQRTYLNRDRDAFKAQLLQHARTFFADRIQDFSEPSLGGLLLDLAADIGDNLSFYLDHQFSELDSAEAVENQNLQRHLRAAGVSIAGASPANAEVAFAIEVPAVKSGASYVPQASALPIIFESTILESEEGVSFELVEDLDFSLKRNDGRFVADIIVGSTNSDGSPQTFIMTLGGSGKFPRGSCISGLRTVETFTIPNNFEQFREITLSNENVTEIISVFDTERNQYYEVESLVQDTVFKGIQNLDQDSELVAENLELIPAPYRFVKLTSLNTNLTTLRFGSGQASTLDNELIPDPSELSLPLFGKKTFSRFAIDPGHLLQTQTLGVSPRNTTLTITYRYGGGLDHNAAATTINTVTTLNMGFAGNPSDLIARAVRASVAVINPEAAGGGEEALTLDELRDKIPAARNSQSRIVTKSDLLARIYTMPSNFGRVFRAGVRSNPRNPLAAQVFIISRDIEGQLVVSPDALKKNLRKFLNEFRLINDAIDIVDASVVNLQVEFKVTVSLDAVKNIVLQDIISRLTRYFDVRNFQIDQPIIIDDIRNLIFNSNGVVSVMEIRFKNLNGIILDRKYSDVIYDVTTNTKKGLIIGPPGSIFEVRFPEVNIIGTAV